MIVKESIGDVFKSQKLMNAISDYFNVIDKVQLKELYDDFDDFDDFFVDLDQDLNSAMSMWMSETQKILLLDKIKDGYDIASFSGDTEDFDRGELNDEEIADEIEANEGWTIFDSAHDDDTFEYIFTRILI